MVSISQDTKNGNHFKEVIKKNIPVVFFDRACEDVDVSKVLIDDQNSAYNAVKHLLEKGYKKIAHFAGPKTLDICKKRFKGYVSAMNDSEMEIDKQLIVYGGLHESDGYNAMDALIKKNYLPDAIFAVNDPVAIGAYQKIKEAGLKIPGDVAVVGFSNNRVSNLVEPQMTTISQPSYEMGKKAAEILIEKIKNKKNIRNEVVVLTANLIVRGST